MAKTKNDQNDKKQGEKPLGDVSAVPENTGNSDKPQTTEVQTESNKKELPVQPEQSNGEQTGDKEDSALDTGSQKETDEEKGRETGDNVNTEQKPEMKEPEETAAKRSRIAKEVFGKNIQCKVLYFTVDFIPFFVKSDAVKHAASLQDNTVVTINRE